MSTSSMHANRHTRRVPRGEAAAPALSPSAAPPLVLIAEDDRDIRLMMKTLLEMKGYRTAEAANGQEAVETAEHVRPDLILVDLQLPHLDGFAVTRFVRRHEALRRVPIVVVSGHDPANHLNLALAVGCNAYIQSPSTSTNSTASSTSSCNRQVGSRQ